MKKDTVSQIRRSAMSMPYNIAKGYRRKTTADYIRMLYISFGSVCELETKILLVGAASLKKVSWVQQKKT